uniref:Uncharacterized protein MANES_06G118500 n=1 Tax=Rhizophora mucronata TaxID=61149 RepID=A0A2P2LA10_RHIMU
MEVAFYDLGSDVGLKKLDDTLLTRSYITGYQASKDDVTVYSALSTTPSSKYMNVSRCGVSGEGSGVTVEGSAPVEEVATPPITDTKANIVHCPFF